jgi:hypothetical protein
MDVNGNDTVGIEVETTFFPERMWTKKCPWRVDTDGSIRTWESEINSKIPLPEIFERERERNVKFGAEIISPIIHAEPGMWDTAKDVMYLLRESGEIPRANMSTHVHVGLGKSREEAYEMIPRIIERLDFLHTVDEILYKISAPTGVPRGVFNGFLYYRPLNSPQMAKDADGAWRFSIGNLREVKTSEELRFCLGRKDLTHNKWYPARYCGINLASIFQHGTLEFRHFNFTNSLIILKAWVYTCLGIVRAIKGGKSPESFEELMALGIRGIEPESCVQYLANNTPKTNVGSITGPVKTHIKNPRYIAWTYDMKIPKGRGLVLMPEVYEGELFVVENEHPQNSLVDEDYTTSLLF